MPTQIVEYIAKANPQNLNVIHCEPPLYLYITIIYHIYPHVLYKQKNNKPTVN